MSKEELEAIESVNKYLGDMVCEAEHQNSILFDKCFLLKELPYEEYKRQKEEYLFWANSYSLHTRFYLSVYRQYYNLGDFDK